MPQKPVDPMRNSETDRWVSWVKDNRPDIALLGEPEVRRIVNRAIDDASVIRFLLMVCGAIAGAVASYQLFALAADPAFDRWHGGLVLAGFAALLTLMTHKYTDVLIARKIESLADGNRYE